MNPPYIGYEPGQVIGKIKLKDGKQLIIRVPNLEDVAEIRELVVPMAEEDYIGDKYYKSHYSDLEAARKRCAKNMRLTRKGKETYFTGLIDNKIILLTNYIIRKIKSGEYKGEYSMELGVFIMKKYRHKGIGGKILDFFIKKAKEMGMVYVIGRFFHENFDSLVLCKSRKLKVYKVDKKHYHKWDRDFDRVSFRILIK